MVNVARQRVGSLFARYPAVKQVAVVGLQTVARARQRGQIDSYLAQNDRHYLRIGSGPHVDPGWLSGDILPAKRGVVYMDATKVLPLPAASFDAVVCEHMIEHIPLDDGIHLLAECRRILSPDGVLRVSTPDLDNVRAIPDQMDTPEVAEYVSWSNRTFGTAPEQADPDNPTYVVNRLMRAWGHTFIFDEPTLRAALEHAGFHRVDRVEPGHSQHAHLEGVDRHAEVIGAAADRIETLALEAST
jgi:predicted SAM-dependent methyltransferase